MTQIEMHEENYQSVLLTYLFQILLTFSYPTEMLNPFKNTKSELQPPCFQARSLRVLFAIGWLLGRWIRICCVSFCWRRVSSTLALS